MNKKSINLFLLGVLCFFISQILLRIPLLNFLNKNISFSMLSLSYPMLISFIILASAGVFEEGFRFLFRKYLLRSKSEEKGLVNFDDNYPKDPIIFGLGHGLCEAVYILTLTRFNLSYANDIFIIIERLLAIVFHICQSILIFKGFKIGRRYSYLILAIVLHTIFNSFIYLRSYIGILGIYSVFAIFDIIYIWILKRNSHKERNI